MTDPRWELADGRLLLRIDESHTLLPSAEEVFNVSFGGSTDVQGVLVCSLPSQDIPGLKISRFPAKLALRVFGKIPDSLWVEQGVVVQGGFHRAAWRHDQLVAGNRWHPVAVSEVNDLLEWMASKGLSVDASLTLGHLIALRAGRNLPVVLVDETCTSETGEQQGGIAPFPPEEVEGLKATLYAYQQTGIRFLSVVADQGVGCILGDEMGLGKTLQVIGLMVHLHRQGRSPHLVVAPATLLENWRREIATFAPQLITAVHAGARRTGTSAGLKGPDVVITSYDMAIRDELLLGSVSWDMVALDEAQNIKNPEALRTQAVKRIPRRVSIAVTGTPVENQLEDLWSVADFALPGLLGSLPEFRGCFADSIEDAVALGAVVSPILLRRRVAEVAQDLPPRIDILQPIDLGDELAAAYESVRQGAIAEYGPAGGLVATTRLRLFCTHPSLVGEMPAGEVTDAPKFARLLELLDEVFALEEKALIFSTYQEMTDLFMTHIPRRWPASFFDFIDGRVAVPERQPKVDRFFEYQGTGALFLNPKAAGTGLNITAANHVIHFNPEWNPALTDQATARAHRRRQTRPVTVHSLFYANTIEDVVMERASFKRHLANGAVSGHEGDVDASFIARALQVSPLISQGVYGE